MTDLVAKISSELSIQAHQIANAVRLLFDEQCTIPFVARYRKEMTGSLDEVQLRDIRDRYHYLTELAESKGRYLKVVEEHCQKVPGFKGKWPELKAKFEACTTKQELEDLYLPFKPKRRTRAQVAKEKGLEALLEKILAEKSSLTDLAAAAMAFLTPADATDVPAEKRVASIDEALRGAADILAERLNETAELRQLTRELSQTSGYLVALKSEASPADEAAAKAPAKSGGGHDKKDAAKYENYYNYREPVATAAPHRIMAVRRGEAEKVLRVQIDVDTKNIGETLISKIIGNETTTPVVKSWLTTVVEDAYKRLIAPSIETEIRLQLKSRGEEEAIRVFSRNLENLLLLPPIPGKTVLGVDPGIRTGSKLAVVSETGKHVYSTTVFPDPGRDDSPKTRDAREKIAEIIAKYNISCIAIGNGTGSREIDKIITGVIREKGFKEVKRLVVNEAGASVYSTDDIAREEFPDLDPTIRSTISIARRLQDPLAELVKIDPRSIGVGQYQHDVNVTKLKSSLEEVVESCVNKVGVNVNTASYKLLGYVSGIGPMLAKTIVTHRDKHGRFASRGDLLKITGFGPKAFEQAAGFLRVPESTNPLDNSAVHPERYEVIEQIAKSIGKPIAEIIGEQAIVNTIPWEKYVTATVGLPTLKDIAGELIKPGRDPREDGARLLFSDEVSTIEDLKQNMVLKGTVTNVTNFGAFVDIGVHQDGLIHISELSDKYVKDPASVIAVGDVIDVRVMDADVKRRRISLSRKLTPPNPNQSAQPPAGAGATAPRRDMPRHTTGAPQNTGDRNQPPRGGQKGRQERPQNSPSFTAADLLSKFNRH